MSSNAKWLFLCFYQGILLFVLNFSFFTYFVSVKCQQVQFLVFKMLICDYCYTYMLGVIRIKCAGPNNCNTRLLKNQLFRNFIDPVTADQMPVCRDSSTPQMAVLNWSLAMVWMTVQRFVLKLSWDNEQPARPNFTKRKKPAGAIPTNRKDETSSWRFLLPRTPERRHHCGLAASPQYGNSPGTTVRTFSAWKWWDIVRAFIFWLHR
jgi:hypothetical protein